MKQLLRIGNPAEEEQLTIEEKQLVRIASARIYTYVSKYCAESLNEITIDDMVKGNLNHLIRIVKFMLM